MNSNSNNAKLGSTSDVGGETKPEKRSSGDFEDNVTPGVDSSTRLMTPPANISIGHLYVYNFTSNKKGSPTIEIPLPPGRNKFQSPAGSSGPFCRICRDGDGMEDLISPCLCTGTVGLVHLSCIEKWLSLAGSDRCEICKYVYITMRSPKPFGDWIRSSASDSEIRRSLVSDLLCFMLLTPLAVVSSFLCVQGARKQVILGNSLEAGCLMALATFLVTIYLIWNLLTCKFHLKNYLDWRNINQDVKVLRIRSRSSTNDASISRMGPDEPPSPLDAGPVDDVILQISDVSPSV